MDGQYREVPIHFSFTGLFDPVTGEGSYHANPGSTIGGGCNAIDVGSYRIADTTAGTSITDLSDLTCPPVLPGVADRSSGTTLTTVFTPGGPITSSRTFVEWTEDSIVIDSWEITDRLSRISATGLGDISIIPGEGALLATVLSGVVDYNSGRVSGSIVTSSAPPAIPTLSAWVMGMVAVFLALVGVYRLRRRPIA